MQCLTEVSICLYDRMGGVSRSLHVPYAHGMISAGRSKSVISGEETNRRYRMLVSTQCSKVLVVFVNIPKLDEQIVRRSR